MAITLSNGELLDPCSILKADFWSEGSQSKIHEVDRPAGLIKEARLLVTMKDQTLHRTFGAGAKDDLANCEASGVPVFFHP